MSSDNPVIEVVTTPQPVIEIVRGEKPVIEVYEQAGPQGPPGDPAEWTQLTQAEYDAILFKDPNTLYVIIG